MKNVTISLDKVVARLGRICAAEQEIGVSCFVGEILNRNMIEEESYHVGMQPYLSQQAQQLRMSSCRYPCRLR